MNRTSIVAILIGVLGIGAIAVVSGGGSGADQPTRVAYDRGSSFNQANARIGNDGMRLLGNSRADLRQVNSGGLGSYSGPHAAEAPDRFGDAPASGDSSNQGSRQIQPGDTTRRNPIRNDGADRNRGNVDRGEQNNRPGSSRPGAGAGSNGLANPAPPGLANPSPPGANPSGPSGPDLSRLPPGLIIPDGLPQSVIDVLIDAADRGVFDGGGNSGGGNGGGSSGGGSSGGGSSGGGNSGGGGGGSNGGGIIIGGGGGGGTGGGPEAQLVWVDRSISGCSALSGQRSRDLYIRLLSPARVLSADSGAGSSGLTVSGAGFTQISRSPFPEDTPPSLGEIQVNPCAEFDTYLAFGPAMPGIIGGTPIYDPTLNAQWFGILVEAAQNVGLFNDNAYYVRLGRFTAPNNQVTIGGTMVVSTAPSGGGQPTNRTLSVPSWSAANGGLITDSNGGGGNGSGGDGNDSDGNGGDDGDGGDDDDGSGGGGDDGGDDDDGGSDDGPSGDISAISLVWHEVDNEDCMEDVDGDSAIDIDLSGARTFDLLVRSPTPDRLIGASTGLNGTIPFRVLFGGPIVQYPGPDNSNLLPNAADIAAHPCLEFDTYFAVGTSPNVMFLSGEPDEDNWPTLLATEWVTDSVVIAQQDPSTFGDNAYYARLMRITLGGPSTVVGEFRLTVVPAGASSAAQTLPITVPLLP